MAIYCMQCGKELPDDAKFCLKCGKPLKSTEAADPQIPDNSWESVRPLWREKTRMEDMGESEETRRPVEQQIIEKVLTTAEKSINYLSDPTTRLSREEFSDHYSRISRELLDLNLCSPDDDEDAEKSYQLGRLYEQVAIHLGRVIPGGGDRISPARHEYERAVEKSKRGSGRKLAFYQDELAKFLRRWNLN